MVMLMEVQCVHCGQVWCEQRHWMLGYQYGRVVDVREFAKEFEAVAVSSGLEIGRFVVATKASWRDVIWVYVEVDEVAGGVGEELLVTMGELGRCSPVCVLVHMCDVVVEGIVAWMQSVRDAGLVLVVKELDGTRAQWLTGWS